MRHVVTLSTMYRHIFHSKLPTKSLFVEKKRSKVGPILSGKYQITYKIIVCGEKNCQNWYYIIQKIIERSILASHVQCLHQKQTSTGLPADFNAIRHKGDILLIRTCSDFYVSLCIDIAMSNRHVVSFHEYSDNR